MANRSRLVINRPPFQIAYGYDGPVEQAAPIANLMQGLAEAGGLNPKPGYFFSVYHTKLLYEVEVEEADEQHNSLVEEIDPTGEGTIINLGFVTGLNATQMLAAVDHWQIPKEHLERIRRGQCPQDGQQLTEPAAPVPTMRLCLRPVEVFVWYALLAAGDPYQGHAVGVLNAEHGMQVLQNIKQFCEPPFNYLATRDWHLAMEEMSTANRKRVSNALEQWGEWLENNGAFCNVGKGEPGLEIDEGTLALLKEAHEWCDQEDKSTEFMLAYMADMANCGHDTVMAYLESLAV